MNAREIFSNTEGVKILHIFPSFGFGGQQARFATLASGLRDTFSHHVVAIDGDYAAQKLVWSGAPVTYHVAKKNLADLGDFQRTRFFVQLFSALQPNILCTYNWGSMEAVLANGWARLPHIHFEDGFGPDERIDKQKGRRVMARRLLLRRATTIVPSKTLENTATTLWKLPLKYICRIENGIDIARYQQSATPIQSELMVGSVGALRAEKNYRRLIEAFLRVAGRARLTIVGDGPERNALKQLSWDRNAQDRISLPGASSEVEKWYPQFDIYALSSDTEQAPLTVMEAMATGLPIVAPNIGDIGSMVAEENRLFITPAGDERAFDEALAHLMQNPDKRALLGAANKKKAIRLYSQEKMIKAYETLFDMKAGGR